MQAELLYHTPDPERAIATAARLCYAPVGAAELMETMPEERVRSVLSTIMGSGHFSTLEHASFTFGIEGVSRSLLAQLTRHRLASYSVQSQRYVKESAFEFVLPPEIASMPETKREFLAAMEEDQRHYERLTELLQRKHETEFLAQGLSEKEARRKAEKKAIEDARFVLPNACATKLICTMNARELMNFFTHRCCNRAQWEIRALATEMLRQVKAAAPNLFKRAGPPCLRGSCPEGKMSCGKASEVRERFGNMETAE